MIASCIRQTGMRNYPGKSLVGRKHQIIRLATPQADFTFSQYNLTVSDNPR